MSGNQEAKVLKVLYFWLLKVPEIMTEIVLDKLTVSPEVCR